jgi:hypothetical protein
MDPPYSAQRLAFAVTTSKMIAGLMGPTLVAIAGAMLLNFTSLPEMAEQISRDPGVIFLSGILLFVAGVAIVRAHNIWTGGWPVLVTVLGWLAILSGLVRMLLPIRLAELAVAFAQKPSGVIAGAAVLLVLGAFLSIKAYSRD